MRSLLPLLVLFLAAPVAVAQEGGQLTKAPAVVAGAEPAYPLEAKAQGLSAEVGLQLDISETGEVLDAQLISPAGHGFDEAALEAARRLRFSAAEIDGRPAAVRIEYRFHFAMKPVPTEAAAPGAGPAEAEAPLAPVNLRGRLLERATKKPIAGATIEIEGSAQAVTSDAEGRFEARGVPEGEVRILVADGVHERYQTKESIQAGKQTQVTYYLQRRAADEFETVVVGQRERKEVSTVALSTGEITRIPGVSGDAVRVVQNLPGVARVPGGFGADLIVRGGNSRDTKVYVDGLEVPIVFHFSALTSVYASELVEDVEFEPGNFGVRYGRATAGRLELKTRDPRPDRLHLVADANLYHATALAEGALTKDLTIAVAARRSYVDGVLNLAADSSPPDAPSFTLAPRYYDYQAKLVFRPSARHTLRFDFFGSDDRMGMAGMKTGGLKDIAKLDVMVGFNMLAASWDYKGEATRARLSLSEGFIRSRTAAEGSFGLEEAFDVTGLRAELSQQLHPRFALAGGLDLKLMPDGRLNASIPHMPAPNEIPRPDDPPVRAKEVIATHELGAWLEGTFKPLEKLTLVPGLRADAARGFFHDQWIDPRLAARWQARPATALKGGVGLYHQPPEFAYVTRQWGNANLKAEGSVQYGAGVEQQIWGPLSLDVQLYYKRLFDLALPTEGPERWINGGTGKSYGAELLVRYKPDGRFFGWISYSLSRTRRDQNPIGYRFATEGDTYDQPHNLVAVGTLELPELWRGLSVGGRLRFTSGLPYSSIPGAIYDADADVYQPLPNAEKDRRMPDFFQLDLRVDKRWAFDTWSLLAYLDVQNVTNRANAEAVSWNYDYTQSGYTSLLPIFPSFGLRAEY